MEKAKFFLQVYSTILTGACLVGIGFIYFQINKEPMIEVHETITIVREKQVYFERMEINQRIQEIQAYEDYDRIIALYGEIAGNRKIARLILNNALVKRIPVNMAFALIKRESGFNNDAMNRNAKDSKGISTDYGLLQLNSQTFRTHLKKNGKDWLLLPENNVDLGLTHLQQLYFRHGESWDMAIIRYNGRFSKGADEHLVSIYRYERELDKLFNDL